MVGRIPVPIVPSTKPNPKPTRLAAAPAAGSLPPSLSAASGRLHPSRYNCLPLVEGALDKTMFPAQFFHRYAFLGFLQNIDDLCLAEWRSFHVVTPGLILPEVSTFCWYYFTGWLYDDLMTFLTDIDNV
jgi:hypothetical protein